MKKLTFKEYYESKKKLLDACDTIPRVRSEYRLTKYCKFPVFESLDTDDRLYVSFKPKDVIEVLWEKTDEMDDYPMAKQIVLKSKNEQEVFPCWGTKKIHKWIDSNTVES